MQRQIPNRARIPVTFVTEVPGEMEPCPLEFLKGPSTELENADADRLEWRDWGDWQVIEAGDGLWNVSVPWYEVAAYLARADGWTDEAPQFSRGEGGAGLKLPSGVWILVADIDITDGFGTEWTD